MKYSLVFKTSIKKNYCSLVKMNTCNLPFIWKIHQRYMILKLSSYSIEHIRRRKFIVDILVVFYKIFMKAYKRQRKWIINGICWMGNYTKKKTKYQFKSVEWKRIWIETGRMSIERQTSFYHIRNQWHKN